MPYALIPDGYTLKKVTKLQKQAVNAKRRHDNMEALLANPTTPPVVGAAALLAAVPILVKLFFDMLEEQNIVLTDDQKSKIEQGFSFALMTSPATAPFVLGKKVWDTLTGGGPQQPARYKTGTMGGNGV